MQFKNTIVGLLIFLFLGCSSSSIKTDSRVDTINSIAKSDTTTAEKENNLSDFRGEYISSYNEPFLIDTTFWTQGKAYKVIFHYFCTMDKGLIIPARYNFDTNKDFVTHNFVSDLILLSDNDTLFKKHITKLTFKNLLDESLKKYGTLLYPDFYIKNDSIEINYSISIPVTDVGIGVNIKFDKKGGYIVGK